MSESKPFFSIIVPVYNTAGYLRECLDSIVSQSETSLELILVNDGSTDNSLVICEEYAQKDDRVRVISQENQGVSAARNTGIRAAKGAYIWFVDSDDVIVEHSLKKMKNKSELGTMDALFFGIAGWNGRSVKNVSMPKQDGVLMFEEPGYIETVISLGGSPCNKVYKSEFLRGHQILFPVGMPILEDGVFDDCFFRFAPTVACMQEICYYYRDREESASNSLRTDIMYWHGKRAENMKEMLFALGIPADKVNVVLENKKKNIIAAQFFNVLQPSNLTYGKRKSVLKELFEPENKKLLLQHLKKDENKLLAFPYRFGICLKWTYFLVGYSRLKNFLLRRKKGE